MSSKIILASSTVGLFSGFIAGFIIYKHEWNILRYNFFNYSNKWPYLKIPQKSYILFRGLLGLGIGFIVGKCSIAILEYGKN